ncbi:MAG: cytidylate kinase-like family protein [Spirochaetota bacterium]|nr:cytidylate kinase-like family protein [Spirochaetota bacterium]
MTRSMDLHISNQLKYWKQQKDKIINIKDEKLFINKKQNLPFITISREYGCGGVEIGETIVKKINRDYKSEPEWALYDKKVLEKISEDTGFTTNLLNVMTHTSVNKITNVLQTMFAKLPSHLTIYRKMGEIIRTVATNGNAIIIGRGGCWITRDMEKGLHIKIVAPLKWRIERISTLCKINKKEAEKLINKKSDMRENDFKEYIKFDISDPKNYHLVLNSEKLSPDECANIIIALIKIKGYL